MYSVFLYDGYNVLHGFLCYVCFHSGQPLRSRVGTGASTREEQKEGQGELAEPRCAFCHDAVTIWRFHAWQTAVGCYLSGLTVLGFVVVDEMTVVMRRGLIGLMVIFAVVGSASAWVAFEQARTTT